MSKITIREGSEDDYGIVIQTSRKADYPRYVVFKEVNYPDKYVGDWVTVYGYELPALINALQTIHDKWKEENP